MSTVCKRGPLARIVPANQSGAGVARWRECLARAIWTQRPLVHLAMGWYMHRATRVKWNKVDTLHVTWLRECFTLCTGAAMDCETSDALTNGSVSGRSASVFFGRGMKWPIGDTWMVLLTRKSKWLWVGPAEGVDLGDRWTRGVEKYRSKSARTGSLVGGCSWRVWRVAGMNCFSLCTIHRNWCTDRHSTHSHGLESMVISAESLCLCKERERTCTVLLSSVSSESKRKFKPTSVNLCAWCNNSCAI